jgi:hypothetical protein
VPSAPFLTTLTLASPAGRGAIVTNLKPFAVDVQKAVSSPEGPLPYVAQGQPAPSSANVWLQLWSIGENEPKKWRGHHVLKPKAAPNQLCFEAPGYLQETASGFEFRLLGSISKGAGNQLGWIWLAIKDGGGNPLLKDGRPPRAPLVCDGAEDEVDVACALLPAAGNTTCPAHAHVFSFTNLTHVIGSQLREGGLLAGFCAHFNPPKDANDASFPTFGEWAARRTHSLALRDGELVVGATKFAGARGETMIVDGMAQLRAKVHAEFLGGQGEPPKINRFFTVTHGENSKAYLGISTGNGWLSLATNGVDHRADQLIDGIAPHVTDDVVWSQCSCHVGAAPSAGKTDFGDLVADRGSIGSGSWADWCRQALAQRGRSDAAVWGHTSAGDALRNQELRAFTRHGNMDLCYLVYGLPSDGKPIGRQPWSYKFMKSWSDADNQPIVWEFVDISLRHPGALIKSRLGK